MTVYGVHQSTARADMGSEVRTESSTPSSTTPSLPTVTADAPPTPSNDNNVMLSSQSDSASLAPTSVAQTLADALEQVYTNFGVSRQCWGCCAGPQIIYVVNGPNGASARIMDTPRRRARKEKAKRRPIDVSNSALASAHAYSSLRKALNVKAQLLRRLTRGGRKQSPLASVPEPGDEHESGEAAAERGEPAAANGASVASPSTASAASDVSAVDGVEEAAPVLPAAAAAPAAKGRKKPPALIVGSAHGTAQLDNIKTTNEVNGMEEDGKASVSSAANSKSPPPLVVPMNGESSLALGIWNSNGSWSEAEVMDPSSRASSMASLQPVNVDDVNLIKELGRGQFGTVWMGTWLGVTVAIKQMHRSTDDSFQEMVKEAEMLAGLRHPNILTFYGTLNGPTPMTLLEYMPSGSLKAGLRALHDQKHGQVPLHTLANIALQVARGMEYLHKCNVVHFDLKAENLLCDLRNLDSPVVKIGDMGLSKQKMTTFVSGNMRGTLPWMAPELFFGDRNSPKVEGKDCLVSNKVDVFSFGIVLWEIWQLGETPYSGLQMSQIFHGVMNDSIRPEVPINCHPVWANMMDACCESDPADRPEFSNLAVTLSELASEATGVSVENWLAGIMPSVAFSKTSSAETVPIA